MVRLLCILIFVYSPLSWSTSDATSGSTSNSVSNSLSSAMSQKTKQALDMFKDLVKDDSSASKDDFFSSVGDSPASSDFEGDSNDERVVQTKFKFSEER